MTSTATSESTFFIEHNQVFELIDIILSSSSSSSSSSLLPNDPDADADVALSKLRTILDKYLECPTLLDPFLERMVQRLSLPARTIVYELFLSQSAATTVITADDGDDDGDDEQEAVGDSSSGTNTNAILSNNDDNEITTNNNTTNNNNSKLSTLMHLFSAIYAISKVRGRKYIQRLLPHEAADVEPVLVVLRWFGWLERVERGALSSLNDNDTDTDATITIPQHEMIQQFQKDRQLQQQKDNNLNNNDNNAEAKTWESLHTILTWLGIISLVPFDLNTIDSSLGNQYHPHEHEHDTNNVHAAANTSENTTSTTTTTITLVQSILSTAASHLNDYGATRETAAACLASLLSRPDLEKSELEGFVNWSACVLHWFRTGAKKTTMTMKKREWNEGNDDNDNDKSSTAAAATTLLLLPMPKDPPSIFLIMGILQTLAAIFKSGHRSNLLDNDNSNTQQHQQTNKLRCDIEALWEQCILVAETSAVNGSSMIVRKLLVKLFARVGCAYLPPRVASWRYMRGKRSLVENLKGGGGGGGGGGGVSSASAAAGKVVKKPNDEECINSSVEDRLFPIPDQVEDAMGQLLRSLTDSATIVRWSAAKGIGRLTERLPAICADDVLDAILDQCSDVEQDKAWHGACLALAELARRGLLLPDRLGEVVPIVVQAIGYDVRRGQHSVGTHVRDAACYVCWAFARAYAPSVLRPHVKELSAALVLTSLFDREVNCRRAASAAFQESVGRQGADNFKHGIAILTTADYYSLGNRIDAYLNLALDVAKFEEYEKPVIRHLSNVKLVHWDIEMRALASKSLARVSKLNPRYNAEHILPKLIEQCFHDDLVVRHGSLLGVAETVLAFGEANLVQDCEVLNDEIKASIAELVPSLEKARLYRGRGGEIMRNAACRMIESISIAGLPLTVKQQVRLLDSVDACLVHPNEDIQTSAAKALSALMTHYFPVSSKGPSSRLQNRVVDKYINIVKTEDNPAATRGFSLGLGYLPAKLLAPTSQVLDSVLRCLSNASKRNSLVGGEGDAETRRNAIISLVNVCKTVGIDRPTTSQVAAESSPVHRMTRDQTDFVFESLLGAMEDYNMDRRGDVGSWSRVAAMEGLEALANLSVEASTTFPSSRGMSNSDTSVVEVIVPSFEKRLDFLAKDVKAKVTPQSSVGTFFDEQLCLSILSALLKQLGEKLDVVRSKAGECLERLLTSDSPRLPFVPCRRILVQALGLGGRGKNWSDPTLTFPLLMKAVNIDDFTEPILSGVVISVGGLTESVAKSSSASLFEWIRGLRTAKATMKMLRMGEVFLALFMQNKRNGRVLLPLLATVDKLLSHGYLDELLCANNGKFLSKLMACLSSEAKGCVDIKRLLAIVGVSLNLLQPHLDTVPTVRIHCFIALSVFLSACLSLVNVRVNLQQLMKKEILPFIVTMLLNPYPRVRRYTAEQLYVKLAEDGDELFDDHECLEEASQLLLSAVWHEENDPNAQLTDSRNRIADLLGIKLTSEQRNVRIGKKGKSRSVLKDEFESYSSLVNSA